MAKPKTYGVFGKDGQYVTAFSVEDAVRYQYDGWAPQPDKPAAEAADYPASPDADAAPPAKSTPAAKK